MLNSRPQKLSMPTYFIMCHGCGTDFRSSNPKAKYCSFCPPATSKPLCPECGRPNDGGFVCTFCAEG